MPHNMFDSAAWYLLSYTNTLSFAEWRSTVKQAYKDVEDKRGMGAAKDALSKMVAYYCMEVAPGPMGRQAISRFRKVYSWQDFRDADTWWLEEWKSRRVFDKYVSEVKAECTKAPSVPEDEIHNDYWGRTALDCIMAEIDRRYQWEKQRYSKENFVIVEACARHTISIFGGYSVYTLYESGILKDRDRIPSLQSMYFVERVLVEELGERLPILKTKEYE